MKFLYCTVECSTSSKIFGEYGVYPGDCCDPIVYANYTANGGAIGFKANNVDGTFNWKIWYDADGGTSFSVLDTYNVCCQYGYAFGEAARTGMTGTDIIDHHGDIKFKNSSGQWNNINNLVCWNDNDADYEWQCISTYEFRVRAGSGDAC